MSRRASTAVAAVALALAAAFAQDATIRRGFSVRIVEPADRAIALGPMKIVAEVEVADQALVERVEFFIDDELIFVDREPPWECRFDFGEQSRAWIIRAVAHHEEDVTVSDLVVTREVPFMQFEVVNRVILWLTVSDRKQSLVTDLERGQFRVFEDGREQRILEFYREDRPIVLAILLDSSGSMKDKLREVHAAASSFVDTLRDEDQALLIDFDDKVFLIQDLTSDRAALKEAIESTEPIGGTAVYDALHAAYRKIGTLDGRKAIVLLSDGEDTASQLSHAHVLEEAKANDTMIYAIGLGGGLGGGARKNVLRELAEVTGGRAFFVSRANELDEVYQRIAEELRTQYYLAYSTENETWNGRWIKLRVEANEPGLDVRHRAGFFAVRAPP